MHYYQHHIGDFIKDTSFLTNEEVGIYVKLLWIYYDTEQALPNSLFELSMKVNARDQQDVLGGILEMFFTLENNKWHHTRCDKEIHHYHLQIQTASKAGKASARKRALNKESSGVERALELRSTDVQLTNNHKPITKNHIDTPVGVSVDVWQDFVKLRKAKKAPVTDNVVKLIQKEADLAGWSMEMALAECVVRGWQSFKADWVKPKPLFGDIAKTTVPSSNVRDPALQKLDEDAKSTKPPPAEILAKIREFAGVKNELL